MENFDEIKNELLELGFNIDSIGTIYWIEALRIVKKNPLNWKITELYKEIGKKYNSTYHRVERGMRHSIENAKPNIQKKYGYYKPIKNQTFLNLIRYKLI